MLFKKYVSMKLKYNRLKKYKIIKIKYNRKSYKRFRLEFIC